MDPVLEETLFGEEDVIVPDTEVDVEETTAKSAGYLDYIKKNPDKKHLDASDRSVNIGPTFKKDDENFGTFTPQTIDRLQAENCLHDICYPPNCDLPNVREKLSTPLPPREPAKTYSFELDSFQKRAINCVERNHNVLISAHTSAGKTTVAEYAVAKSIREGTRVIYTSPIKALSNQKYRDLYEEFTDVGLMTGDVTINASASCIVMTTEILRNMLYRGSEVIREVSWVIFDEIHYMRNKSRGVIYEECLILLPSITKFIFLSATIPNATEFGCWVAKLNNTPCNVVYTEKRPVPLKHYVAPKGGKGLTLILDENKNFLEKNFVDAISQIKQDNFERTTKQRKRKRGTSDSDLFSVIKLIMSMKNYPAIVFSFSRRDCETNALLMSRLDFNSDSEKKMIEQIFKNAIDSLSSEDRKLPQVSSILPLFKRGVGIHHSGLLPILKEITEILFQEGLLKCLFATETFAMGVNMPAKTVVFSSLRKFDGVDNRNVTSGEYIQMSGRAGRRGIDEEGLVILMLSEKLEPNLAKKILGGTADPLNSSFNLGYNMLLNLLRVEGSDPEYMIAHSFHQFQSMRKIPKLEKEISQIEDSLNKFSPMTEELDLLYKLKCDYEEKNNTMKAIRNKPENLLPFLNAGRLVKIVCDKTDWGLGVIINFEKVLKDNMPKTGIFVKDINDSRFTHIIDVFLAFETDSVTKVPIAPRTLDSKKTFGVLPCSIDAIDKISTIRVYLPKSLRSEEGTKQLRASLDKVFETFPDGNLPLLDPIDNMNIGGRSFRKINNKLKKSMKLFEEAGGNSLSADKVRQLGEIEQVKKLQTEKSSKEQTLKNIENNKVVRKTLRKMRKVLQKLGHITDDNVVNIKGRVACDISISDELLTTELLLTGCFNDLNVEQIVSLASCLTGGDRAEVKVRLKNELADPYFRLQKAAKHVATTIRDAKIEIDFDQYVNSFRPNLMEVAYAWCKGAKFAQICKMTNSFEGAVIRVIRRLGELLEELSNASKIIGNEELAAKFEKGSKLIKRDIIFAASLYL